MACHGHNCDNNGYIDIPPKMVTYTEDNLIHKIYGNIAQIPQASLPKYFLDHVILAPRNTNVQETNENILAKVPGGEIIFDSADTIEPMSDLSEDHHDYIPQDFLHSLEPPSLPLSHLKLKIGCPLMLQVVATTFMIKYSQLPAQLFGKCPVFL